MNKPNTRPESELTALETELIARGHPNEDKDTLGRLRLMRRISALRTESNARHNEALSRNEPPAPRAGERERDVALVTAKKIVEHCSNWSDIQYRILPRVTALVEQRDRLFMAAKFLLAMNATNYDRDAMRSEGGFDALQKAVDYAIEQSAGNAGEEGR